MDKELKYSIIISVFLFIIAIFWFVYEYSKVNIPQRTFSISGEGKEIVIPNIAEIRIGVITEGENLKIIQNENSLKINKIIEFLKKEKINENDIKTESYFVTPKYDYKFSPYKIVGYSINQTLLVKIRDLNKVGEILEKAIENGANNVSGPNFNIDDPFIYLEKAREKAIKDAKDKAIKIAKAAGFKLGKIVNITESPITESYPLRTAALSTTEGGQIPQIEPGSKEVKVHVNITFEIK